MRADISFEAHDKPLSEVLFSNKKYQIPRYQRPYAWGIDQVSELWEDLITSDEPYFLGSFIFNTEPEKETGLIDIIDGQQRLLTLTIMAAVLRNLAKGLKSDRANLYQRQDLAIEDRDGNLSYRIQPSATLADYFRKYIQEDGNDIDTSLPKTSEEKRVKDNYLYLYEQVFKELSKFSTTEAKVEELNRLRKKISDLVVISVEITKEEDAYEIFETTNARGLELSVADLLKNLIFNKIPAGTNRDFAKEVWQEISQDIESTNTELRRFIRYFWISKYGFIPEKKLYREIKTKITDWNQLLDDLWTNSVLYNKLLEGKVEDFQDISKHGSQIFYSVEALRLMQVSQCYVLLMAILRNIGKIGTDPLRIIQFVEKFTFQYSVIGKQPTNRIEKIYSKYAIKIEEAANQVPDKKVSGKIQSIFAELMKELMALAPSDQLFTERFMDLAYRNSEETRKLLVYILSKFDFYFNATDELKINYSAVNIEHVLPVNPNKDWALSKREIRDYVNLLGNLTLISKKINSRLQNQAINDKLPELEKSQMEITRQLVLFIRANNCEWNEGLIHKRQSEMASLAYNSIWKL